MTRAAASSCRPIRVRTGLRIGLYERRDGRVVRREQQELDVIGERTPLDLADADLVLLNDDDLTYAKARLDERSLRTVEESLSKIEEPLARALVWSSLWNATRDGELDAARYVAIVRTHGPVESTSACWRVSSRTPRTPSGTSSRTATVLQPSAVGRMPRGVRCRPPMPAATRSCPGHGRSRPHPHSTTRTTSRCGALLDGDVPAGLVVDPDLRWQLLTALVTTGHADLADISAEQERDDTGSGRTAARRARSSRPDAAVRREAWDSAWSDFSLSNDHLDAEIEGFRAGGRRDLISGLDHEYFARIGRVWSERSIEIARRLVIGCSRPANRWSRSMHGWRRTRVSRRRCSGS